MPAAITIRDDYSACELRKLAARARDGHQSRRLLALAAVRPQHPAQKPEVIATFKKTSPAR